MYHIATDPIDAAELERTLRSVRPDGGVVVFMGVVRADGEGARAVRALVYEAHAALALAQFEQIGNEARERFGDVALGIAHRVGSVPAGQTAVAVVATAAHRAAAFAACAYAIDELKRRAPIWKRECYADGSSAWKANSCDE